MISAKAVASILANQMSNPACLKAKGSATRRTKPVTRRRRTEVVSSQIDLITYGFQTVASRYALVIPVPI
jgi:hypothetical protein